jgi:hypothetical protein
MHGTKSKWQFGVMPKLECADGLFTLMKILLNINNERTTICKHMSALLTSWKPMTLPITSSYLRNMERQAPTQFLLDSKTNVHWSQSSSHSQDWKRKDRNNTISWSMTGRQPGIGPISLPFDSICRIVREGIWNMTGITSRRLNYIKHLM